MCDRCLNVPRHGSVVITSAKTLAFSSALAQMPRGEAVYGWPYYASRYLAPEFLFKQHLPKTWNTLREAKETHRKVERQLNWVQRLLKRFQRKRTGGP